MSIEGITEKVSHFIASLNSIYNKNKMNLWTKMYFLTLQKGLNIKFWLKMFSLPFQSSPSIAFFLRCSIISWLKVENTVLEADISWLKVTGEMSKWVYYFFKIVIKQVYKIFHWLFWFCQNKFLKGCIYIGEGLSHKTQVAAAILVIGDFQGKSQIILSLFALMVPKEPR